MSPQRSTAMMSAPAPAKVTAWDRPWPRAAPVMNATFESRTPIADSVQVSRSGGREARVPAAGPAASVDPGGRDLRAEILGEEVRPPQFLRVTGQDDPAPSHDVH